jgi:hypothetical protein
VTAAPLTDPKARGAFTFFKVMAFVVGIGLLVLVLEMVLHWGFDNNALRLVAAAARLPLHDLSSRRRPIWGFKVGWSLPKMVGIMLAGCVPFLSFVVERRVAAEIAPRLA